MKRLRTVLGILIVSALAAGVWALAFHSDWFRAKGDDDDEGPEVIPVPTVSLGKVTRATMRRYAEGTGTVEAEPARADHPGASSKVASPVAGILAEVRTVPGERVERGGVLFRLDDRVARSEEEKARAALGSARATLEKLKSFPRPEQIKVAEMQVDRAKQAVEFSTKKQARTAQLVADKLASEKTVQEVDLELATAKSDLGSAEKQLALLRASPTREEVAEAQAKVVEAEKALEGAQLQRSLYEIHAPISGTVLRARGSVGEAVDTAAPLAEVTDLDRLVVEGSVPARSRELLREGEDVEVRTGPGPAPGRPPVPALNGKVVFVGSDVDRKNDAVLVRVALPPKSPVLPGQFVRIRVVVEEHKDHLVVPRECVVRTPEGKDAVVGFLGEKAVQKPVQLGIADGDLVEVEGDDVSEDDAVVTKGAYGLPGEAKVRVDAGAPKAPAQAPKK